MRVRLRGWARSFLRLPPAEFDDSYQTAWLKLLDRQRRGRPVRNLEHALRWEIGNAWREECRRRHRRPTAPLELVLETGLIGHIADVAEQAEGLATVRILLEAAARLPRRQWQVLLLRDICGLAPDDVCRELSLSRRVYRAEHARAANNIAAAFLELLGGPDAREGASRPASDPGAATPARDELDERRRARGDHRDVAADRPPSLPANVHRLLPTSPTDSECSA